MRATERIHLSHKHKHGATPSEIRANLYFLFDSFLGLITMFAWYYLHFCFVLLPTV